MLLKNVQCFKPDMGDIVMFLSFFNYFLKSSYQVEALGLLYLYTVRLS